MVLLLLRLYSSSDSDPFSDIYWGLLVGFPRRWGHRAIGSCFRGIRETREHPGRVVRPSRQRVLWSSLRPSWNRLYIALFDVPTVTGLSFSTPATSPFAMPAMQHRLSDFGKGKQPKLAIILPLSRFQAEFPIDNLYGLPKPLQPAFGLPCTSRRVSRWLSTPLQTHLAFPSEVRLSTTIQMHSAKLAGTLYRHPWNGKQGFLLTSTL